MTRPVQPENHSVGHLIESLAAVQEELAQLESRSKQAEEEVRKTVTRELLERFEIEFHKLGSEFEEQRRHTIEATEAAAEVRYKHAIEEAERGKQELKRELETALKDWEAERKLWTEKIASVDHEEEFREAKARWSAERNALKSEAEQARQELLERFEQQINQLKAEFEERRVKTIAAAESAAEIRFGQALTDAKQQFELERKELNGRIEQSEGKFQAATDRWNEERRKLEEAAQAKPAIVEKPVEKQLVSEKTKAEISRVEGLIRDISRKIDNTASDLGAEIRLNRERTELEAYLNGLRYDINQK